MGKMINFDQFMAEKTKEVISIKIFGKTYQVKKEIPAIVPVMMARAEENDGDGQEAMRMVMRAADSMLGKNVVDELCEKGLSVNDLSALVQKLFKEINGFEDDDESQELDDESGKVARKNTSKK